MKIIIGLGNPGKQYAGTRHNIGFELLDDLRKKFSFPEFVAEEKFEAEITSGYFQANDFKEKVILVKPQKFMNLSGKSVVSILNFYKLLPDSIIVVHDDLDILVGRYKIATDSSSAGHNGVQNIIERLGTQKFIRVRVGIGQEKNIKDEASCSLKIRHFVLEKFTPEEKEKISALKDELLSKIEKMIRH